MRNILRRDKGLARFRAVAVFLALAAFAATSTAEEYLPLSVGNSWEYVTDAGMHETQTVIGMTELMGTDVFDVEFSQSYANEGLHNYWTGDAEGGVFLWGFFLDDGDWGYAYSPPATFVDAPLFVGKNWSSVSDIYLLPEMTFVGQLSLVVEVTDEGSYNVPAGNFHGFEITIGVGESELYDANGISLQGLRSTPEGGREPWYLWSEGLGQIRYYADAIYQLSAYNLATPVEPSTWGQIKALYHD